MRLNLLFFCKYKNYKNYACRSQVSENKLSGHARKKRRQSSHQVSRKWKFELHSLTNNKDQ